MNQMLLYRSIFVKVKFTLQTVLAHVCATAKKQPLGRQVAYFIDLFLLLTSCRRLYSKLYTKIDVYFDNGCCASRNVCSL